MDTLIQLRTTLTGIVAALGLFASASTQALVISQVYGGGGNSGALYTHDFIEIFNNSASSIDLGGLSVQYASAAGSTWQQTNLSGLLNPYQYYLVQEAAGAGGSLALPTPDAVGSIALSATSGKMALVNSVTQLSGTCPNALILDFVGYGIANCFEGAATPALSNTQAAMRLFDGLTDSDNNSLDFALAAPAPRNTTSPLNIPVVTNPVSEPSSIVLMLTGSLVGIPWLRRRRSQISKP